MEGIKTMYAPLLLWSANAMAKAANRASTQVMPLDRVPNTPKNPPWSTKAVALQALNAKQEAATPHKASLSAKPEHASNRVAREIHRRFGLGIALAPAYDANRPPPMRVNASMLPAALSLSDLGIANRASRQADAQEYGVFFGDADTVVNKNAFQQSEHQRAILGQEILALGNMPIGQMSVNTLAQTAKPTQFFVFDERIHPYTRARPKEKIFGLATTSFFVGRFVSMNARVYRHWAQDLVFPIKENARLSIEQKMTLLHESEHIRLKDLQPLWRFGWEENKVKAIERAFLRFNGHAATVGNNKEALAAQYVASPAIGQYSRAFLYVQLNALADEVNQNPEKFNDIVLTHLRQQAALGINVEQYVSWLLPELDKRLDAHIKS